MNAAGSFRGIHLHAGHRGCDLLRLRHSFDQANPIVDGSRAFDLDGTDLRLLNAIGVCDVNGEIAAILANGIDDLRHNFGHYKATEAL